MAQEQRCKWCDEVLVKVMLHYYAGDKPFADELLMCPQCGRTAKKVEEVKGE